MKSSTLFLQAVIVLIGIAAVALLLWEPHLEGRNAHATLFQIYFNDPFLAYAYIASVPFFAALYHAFKMLDYARRNTVFTGAGVAAMRAIKHCAAALVGFIAVGEVFIILGSSDDRAGGIAMGLLMGTAAAIVAATANVLELLIRGAAEQNRAN